MMKSILKAILGISAALLCFALYIPRAHAEEVKIDITATPTELPDSGSVTFTFEITNYNADYPMKDVAISNNGTVCYEMKDQIIPQSGSARDIPVTLNISQSQLGKPIPFVVTWTRNGEPMSQEASITVQQAENPIITVMRTASTTNAKPGDKVVLTYTVKNTTKFDMSGITLIDENVSDTPILQLDSLRASGTYSIDYTYTMGEESVTSTPFVTYTVNGKTKTFSSLDPLELVMVLIRLDLKIQAGTPTSSGVTFTIDVENTGTQEIRDISISDERANLVNDVPFSLAPGEQTTFSYIVVPVMSEPLRSVQFSLAGTDSFENPYTLAPKDVYEIYPYVDSSQINVTVRAETVTPWTSESGKLSARVTISNLSTVELTSITVLETSIGVVKNFEMLPAGETSFDLDIQLGSPRNLSITIKGYDPTGANRELASCVMPVAYGTETASAESATPAPSGSTTIFDGLMTGVTKVLIVLAALMVLSFIILIALMAMERSKTPRLSVGGEDDLDDYFEDSKDRQTIRKSYDDKPDPEEIRYTKRMLTQNSNEYQEFEQAKPIYLPPPAPVSEPVVRTQEKAEHVTQETTGYPARQASDKTRRTVISETEACAEKRAGRPDEREKPAEAREQIRTSEPAKQRAQAGVPRVFEYRQQPKPQAKPKQTVTRVHRLNNNFQDDEE
ncbi:MAG: hypothetical protein LLF75_07000 [Eubacteriales bacterium]|nr:hypothetical protein [Eubacteriales bacterium]